ncbi:MAG: C39 family peptidase, partial [Candidatus Aenigmarchaeota archaeon]|nr:C39 family peptidase [Candidatus Aenigmarchaeota archaeon]
TTPQKIILLNVPLDKQKYRLSCELSASAMVISYYRSRTDTDYFEEEFVKKIPKHCNPNRGFRGDVNGIVSIDCRPPYGYGVYNQPVADLLNQNNVPSEALNLKECNNPNDAGYDRLERYIREGRPVIVWISGSNANIVEETYENEKFKLIFGEHAIVVVGVEKEGNDRYFIVNDPLKGERKFRQFKRWADFDCMAVIGPSKS